VTAFRLGHEKHSKIEAFRGKLIICSTLVWCPTSLHFCRASAFKARITQSPELKALFREAFRLEICAPPRLHAFRLGNRMPLRVQTMPNMTKTTNKHLLNQTSMGTAPDVAKHRPVAPAQFGLKKRPACYLTHFCPISWKTCQAFGLERPSSNGVGTIWPYTGSAAHFVWETTDSTKTHDF
jgi:hypothetical protein